LPRIVNPSKEHIRKYFLMVRTVIVCPAGRAAPVHSPGRRLADRRGDSPDHQGLRPGPRRASLLSLQGGSGAAPEDLRENHYCRPSLFENGYPRGGNDLAGWSQRPEWKGSRLLWPVGRPGDEQTHADETHGSARCKDWAEEIIRSRLPALLGQPGREESNLLAGASGCRRVEQRGHADALY
jgi:hypothetical protein